MLKILIKVFSKDQILLSINNKRVLFLHFQYNKNKAIKKSKEKTQMSVEILFCKT